jgi:Cys-tRNA(Pro)/Cys-tRNA(Cys) deacylase
VSHGSKTQAQRLLEAEGIPYQEFVFPESIHDAAGVAEVTGLSPDLVYKTLVVLLDPPEGKPALILAPALFELDLKRTAQQVGAKRVEMASRAEAERLTGLRVGGVSALALTRRRWPVFLDRRAQSLDSIVVSAGRRGRDLRLPVEALVRLTGARWIDAARPGLRSKTGL